MSKNNNILTWEEIHEKSQRNLKHTKVLVKHESGNNIRLRVYFFGDVLVDFRSSTKTIRMNRNRAHKVESARNLIKHYVGQLVQMPIIIDDWKTDEPYVQFEKCGAKWFEISDTYNGNKAVFRKGIERTDYPILDTVMVTFDDIGYKYDEQRVCEVIEATTAKVKGYKYGK